MRHRRKYVWLALVTALQSLPLYANFSDWAHLITVTKDGRYELTLTKPLVIATCPDVTITDGALAAGSCLGWFFENETNAKLTTQNTTFPVAPKAQPILQPGEIGGFEFCGPQDNGVWVFEIGDGPAGLPDAKLTLRFGAGSFESSAQRNAGNPVVSVACPTLSPSGGIVLFASIAVLGAMVVHHRHIKSRYVTP